jgi:hypothetical protein
MYIFISNDLYLVKDIFVLNIIDDIFENEMFFYQIRDYEEKGKALKEIEIGF